MPLVVDGMAFFLALVLSLYGTPLARKAALRFNIVDRPDGRLKRQAEPVPYLGGLAVYLSFLITLAMTFDFSRAVLGLLLAGTIVVMLGLIDDFGVLTPGAKFAGQLVAVFVLIKSDIRIELSFLPYWAQVALTMIWMVGLINAFNIIDVMDGLAGGVAAVSAIFLFIAAVATADADAPVQMAALAGALLGFLFYNRHPARIYMGDAGSMFIGFLLGAVAMTLQYTHRSVIGLFAPVLILGVPIFDTFFVMVIRYLRGIPVFLGSPDHFALRLRRWALTVPQVVAWSCAASLVLGGAGLGVMWLPFNRAVMLVAAVTMLLLGAAVWLKRMDMTPQGTGRHHTREGTGGRAGDRTGVTHGR
ncbi:MAG: undecaprenyl/decaprenyl-phosphate alpha-N-acetylglucosaminyl 1-phosphate transferase [Nitrospirae bacterium]|nr:undecaprenyl/decaprenyl-phosphate alpha-N-acetylglucosaminyl 1-phosphate transferase [Nitrospirota bacterium]